MNSLKLSLIMCAAMSPFICEAQQDPLYSQYINNPFVINPAYAGLNKNLTASTSYRYQWSGFAGSPRTINANGNISLYENRMGAGVMLVRDEIGSQVTSEFFGSYAYHLPLSKTLTLSFGLQAGLSNYKTSTSGLTIFDQTDVLFQGSVGKTAPNIGAGIILSNDRFLIGLSVPRMLNIDTRRDGIMADQYSRHFYSMVSYMWFVSEAVRFRPSLLLKAVNNAPLSVDVNASFILHEKYQVGLISRNLNSYGLLTQLLFKDAFRIGYVFEVPTAESVGTRFTTHELTLGLKLNVLRHHSSTSIFSF